MKDQLEAIATELLHRLAKAGDPAEVAWLELELLNVAYLLGANADA